MTVDEIAKYLKVRPSTVYQWKHQGFIPHIKLGNLVRFRISQVEKWLEARTAIGRHTIRASII